MQRIFGNHDCRVGGLADGDGRHAGAGLADPASAHHHSAWSRRRRRRVHASARRRVEQEPGAAVHCRESPGRRLEHRHARLRGIAARRLHALCPVGRTSGQFLFKQLPFNPEKDFEPITALFINSNALVANASLNVNTIADLVALAKAKPGTLSYGSFSFVLVYFMDKLNKQHGIDIVRVPFRSGNEVVNAVMSGSTPIAFLGLSNMLPQIRSGHIRGIALNASARSPLFPGIPTLKEATGEDYPPPWFGLFAPAGTPRTIINRVHGEVFRIAGDPAWRQKNFIERAVEPAVGPSEEFARFIAYNRAFAAKIAKESAVEPK
jgi:tripartite-type tricarboxylate transporter receptor subunit TctC